MEVMSFLIGSELILGIFQFFLGRGAQPIEIHYNKHTHQLQKQITFQFPQISKTSNPVSLEQFLFIIKQMGTNFCAPQKQIQQPQINYFPFIFDQDNYENRIVHTEAIICHTEEIMENMNICADKLKASKRLYKDPTMKTNQFTLKTYDQQREEIKCTFERPYAFLPKTYTARGQKYDIFNSEDSNASQIVLKDEAMQYFGVFLCFLADHPHLIKPIILNEPNTYGIYAIKMNINCKKQIIYIDDYIVCTKKQSICPMFSQPVNNKYMWTCLLQKAWLKVKGQFVKKIQKLQPMQVVSHFLSYPVEKYKFYQKDPTYNILLLKKKLKEENKQAGVIITTKKEPPHKIGISGKKIFYLLGIHHHNSKTLYYFRSPYEDIAFRGQYQVIPKQIQDKIKIQTNVKSIPTGNFLLQEEEFIEQVEEFMIINYNSKSNIVTQQIINLEQEQIYYAKVKLVEPGLVSMSVDQNPIKTKTGIIYSPISYLVFDLTNKSVISDLDDHLGCFGSKKTNLIENTYKQLNKGEYLIRLNKKQAEQQSNQKYSNKQQQIIIVTAPRISEICCNQQKQMNQTFNQLLIQMGRRKLQQNKKPRIKLLQQIEFTYFWLVDLAIVYIQKIKDSPKQIKVEVRFPQIKNLACLTMQLGKKYVCLPPITNYKLLIFQKIKLAEEAVLGKFMIESF